MDVVQVFDAAVLAALKEVRNDQWFREQRAQFVSLDPKGKLLELRSYVATAGKPFKVKQRKGVEGVLVFSRGDRRVREETPPDFFPPRKRFLGLLGGGGHLTVVKQP
ncbi:MAG: hypothetical protein HS113_15375 [Verrucomicrobiales bacterium]|nr:hypothetical protein [Verrucomicrobiales bacterium]